MRGVCATSAGITLTGRVEQISPIMFTVPFMGLLGDYPLFTGSGRSRISRIASTIPGVATTPFMIFHR